MKRLAVVAALLALALPSVHAETTVRVFAAASLKESFEEIGRLYEAKHHGIHMEFEFAGSQVLRTQIEQGAPADVFASADNAQMAPLVRAGLTGKSAVFAHNRMVVVTTTPTKVRALKDLARHGVRIVLAEPTVPAGRYAAAVITKLAAAKAYGPPFAADVAANVVSRETSVRAVLAKMTLGEADAGFVYATDARQAGNNVRVMPIPSRFNVAAAYPIAVTSRGIAARDAAGFVALVRSGAGKAVLLRHGFAP